MLHFFVACDVNQAVSNELRTTPGLLLPEPQHSLLQLDIHLLLADLGHTLFDFSLLRLLIKNHYKLPLLDSVSFFDHNLAYATYYLRRESGGILEVECARAQHSGAQGARGDDFQLNLGRRATFVHRQSQTAHCNRQHDTCCKMASRHTPIPARTMIAQTT
ncbi:hypothetical protein D3C75_172830 [compost metagenome]